MRRKSFANTIGTVPVLMVGPDAAIAADTWIEITTPHRRPQQYRCARFRTTDRAAHSLASARTARAAAAQAHQFDAQAWALVHFLLFGDDRKRATQLDQFFNLVSAGSTHEAARAEAFGPMEQLEADFVRYLGRDIFGFAKNADRRVGP